MPRLNLHPNLRTITGCGFDQLTRESLESLIGVSESELLEVKSQMYSSNDRGNQEIALDIAALGNAGGGLLLIGFDEADDVLRCPKPVERDGSFVSRIEQVVNSSIVPHLSLAIRWIDYGEDTAVLAVLVPPSLNSPHLVRREDKFQAPIRRGSRRVQMSESEIAERYRQRFNSSSERANRLIQMQDEIQQRSGHLNCAILIVSTVPEYPGNINIDSERLNGVKEQFLDFARQCPSVFRTSGGSANFSIGLRRMILADYRFQNEFLFRHFYLEAHRDGAISMAIPMGRYDEPNQRSTATESFVHMQDEEVALSVLEAVLLLGFFFNLSECSGDVSLAMRLVNPVIDGQDVDLRFIAPSRTGLWSFGDFHDQSRPNRGFGDILSDFPGDDFSTFGSSPIQLAGHLCRDLLSAFGIHGPAQFTLEGALRMNQFSSVYQSDLTQWANRLNVTVV
jgi:hypothetical protein